MLKINLLPKEVLERRRYEGWYGRVILYALLAVGVALLVWAWFLYDTKLKNDELQATQEQSAQYTAAAEQLAIFQNKEKELQQREAIAQTALGGRVNFGQVASDISLVLPDEVWLDLLSIDQDKGVIISANTPRTAGESTDVAYKSVAKTLVRLSQLPELYDVWLTTAANSEWSKWAPKVAAASTGGAAALPVSVVSFQASGKLSNAPTSSSGSPSGSAASKAGTSAIAPAAAAQGAVNSANASSPPTQ